MNDVTRNNQDAIRRLVQSQRENRRERPIGEMERPFLQGDMVLRETISHVQSPTTWTIPSHVSVVLIEAIGAGGGGGARGNGISFDGGTYWQSGVGGGGGQSGSRVLVRWDVALNGVSELHVVVGEGGTGGLYEEGEVPENGGDGGDTTLSVAEDDPLPSIRAIGGRGGLSGGNTPLSIIAGAGGSRRDFHLISPPTAMEVSPPVFGGHGQFGPIVLEETSGVPLVGWGGRGGQHPYSASLGQGGDGAPYPGTNGGRTLFTYSGIDGGDGVVRIYY